MGTSINSSVVPRKSWTREEQLLAFNLYCKLPFGQYHARNPRVIELSELIGRTPSAIAMKLSNFASFDPIHQERGIKGLSHSSKTDKAIWDEFQNNWEKTAVESEAILLEKVGADKFLSERDDVELDLLRPTETERAVKVRLGQRFFRQTVLTSYGNRCCICGIPIPRLLIASHIIPWRDRKDLRLNPRNGLCLCALHDRGFDQGFITVNSAYQILISPVIRQYMPHEALTNYFQIYHDRQIHLPDKFLPDIDFLQTHHDIYFLRVYT